METLPDEIIHKINQFIHPIFEYCEYQHQIFQYKLNKRFVDTTLLSSCIRSEFRSLESETNTIVNIKNYYNKLEYSINYINQFIKKNPKLKRPNKTGFLSDFTYKTTWDTCFNENQIIHMENDIMDKRTIDYWHPFDVNLKLKLNCELLFLLRKGQINDLKKSCLLNNISFTHSYNCKNEYTRYLVRKLLQA